MYFHVVCLGVHVFHILSILNIKTCSFQFSFPLSLHACKENICPLFFPLNFTVENAFVYTASKTLCVCTNSYEKNRNDSSEGKKQIRKQS